MRRLAAVPVAAVIVLAGVAAAAPAALRSKPALRVSPNPVAAGRILAIRGSADGCPVGDTVTVLSRAFSGKHEFAGVPAVYGRVRSGGSFRIGTRIPAGRRAGTYAVTARCGGGNLGVLVRLHVKR